MISTLDDDFENLFVISILSLAEFFFVGSVHTCQMLLNVVISHIPVPDLTAGIMQAIRGRLK